MIAAALARSLRDLRTRRALARCAEIGRGAVAEGRIWIHGRGVVRVGEGVHLDGRTAPIELHAAGGAEIVLEPGVRVDGGASIEARRSVRIGARSRVGRFCKILDNHFHRTTAHEELPESAAIVVEEDVELGVRSILLPGTRVGRGAVIRAGTVVAKPIPAGAVAAGVPMTVRRAP